MNSLLILVALVAIDPGSAAPVDPVSADWKRSKEETAALLDAVSRSISPVEDARASEAQRFHDTYRAKVTQRIKREMRERNTLSFYDTQRCRY